MGTENKYQLMLEKAEYEIEQATKERTAVAKCKGILSALRWFGTMMEMLATNDIHALQETQMRLADTLEKRTNKITILLVTVLVVVVVTNQQITKVIKLLAELIF